MGVIRGRVVAPDADLGVGSERSAGEPDPLAGAHCACPPSSAVDDERAEPQVVGRRGEPQEEASPGPAHFEIPRRLLVEIGQELERTLDGPGGRVCRELDRRDEGRCSAGGRSADDLLDSGPVADEHNALAVARERGLGVDCGIRGDLHDRPAAKVEDADVGGARLVRDVCEPPAVGSPRGARLGRRRARHVQRPTAPGSDDEEVAAGGERDPLSSGRPGRLFTARERSALDAVGSQEDDRPVSLDRKSPSVRGPGGRGFLELGCRQAAAVRSVRVGDVDVCRATRAGSEIREPAAVRRPRGIGGGWKDEPRAAPPGDVDASARHLGLREGERRPRDR